MEEALSFFGYDVAPEAFKKTSFEENPSLFRIKSGGAEAFLEVRNGTEFVLLAKSHVAKAIKEYVNTGVKDLHETCVKDKTLIEDGAFYLLTKDLTFSSPSAAAEFMDACRDDIDAATDLVLENECVTPLWNKVLKEADERDVKTAEVLKAQHIDPAPYLYRPAFVKDMIKIMRAICLAQRLKTFAFYSNACLVVFEPNI